jgi:predicted RNase H-like nuclease (RuvC/YqgF family)
MIGRVSGRPCGQAADHLSVRTGTDRVSERWMTYAELGQALGRSSTAARSKALRKHWRRQVGNDGMARVLVPEAELKGTSTGQATDSVSDYPTGQKAHTRPITRPDRQPGARSDARETELLKQLGELQRELAALAQRLATAEGRAGTAEAQVEGLRAVLDAERRRGDELHARAHEMTTRAEHMERERDRALERLDRAIERLDQVQAAHVDELLAIREQMAVIAHDRDRAAEALAAHLALPWWRRLFA